MHNFSKNVAFDKSLTMAMLPNVQFLQNFHQAVSQNSFKIDWKKVVQIEKQTILIHNSNWKMNF